MKIPIPHSTPPTKPGRYLFKGKYCGDVDLITVAEYPETFHGGVSFSAYLGVCEYRGKNVAVLQGQFSDALEFE